LKASPLHSFGPSKHALRTQFAFPIQPKTLRTQFAFPIHHKTLRTQFAFQIQQQVFDGSA
jgi:hypothetical protein